MANEQVKTQLNSLSGTETVLFQIGGLGGTGMPGPASLLQNARDIVLTSGSGAATFAMTVSQSSLMWTGTAPTTLAVTLPPQPCDGTIVTIGTDTTLTTMVTVTAATGDTLAATFSSQTISAGGSAMFQYSASNTKWYRLR